MKKSLLLILILTLSNSTFALNLNLFKPAQTQKFNFVEGATPLSDQKNYFFGAFYQFINKPIVSYSKTDPLKISTLISGMNIINFSASRIENEFVQWGITGAAIQTKFSSTKQFFSLGDSSIYLKYYFPKDFKGIKFSLMPQVYMPTGKSEYYSSDTNSGYELKLALEKNISLFDISLNIGYLNSPSAIKNNLDYRSRILASLGVYFSLTDKLGVVGEVTTARTLPYNNNQNPGEIFMGARYKFGDIELLSGVTAGNISNNQSNNFSFTSGIRYVPQYHHESKKEFIKRITKQLLNLSEKIEFSQDSSKIDTKNKLILKKIIALIKSNNYTYKKITLRGFTNQDGSSRYNEKLSLNRAKAVKNFFVREGISENSLKAKGFGEIISHSQKNKIQAKLKNRRVEFKVE